MKVIIASNVFFQTPCSPRYYVCRLRQSSHEEAGDCNAPGRLPADITLGGD